MESSMLAVLFLVSAISLPSDIGKEVKVHVCTVDPQYSCCQACQSRELNCSERAKSDSEEKSLAKTLQCNQMKINCEKKCDKGKSIKAE